MKLMRWHIQVIQTACIHLISVDFWLKKEITQRISVIFIFKARLKDLFDITFKRGSSITIDLSNKNLSSQKLSEFLELCISFGIAEKIYR